MDMTDMPGKKIIFHMGFRKVGSTTIQERLRKNSGLLPENVAIFCRSDETKAWRKAAFDYVDSLDPQFLDTISGEAENLCTIIDNISAQTIIVSDENLSGNRIFHESGATIFDWALEVCKLIEKTFSAHDVEFVFYYRDFEAWLQSCYNQAIKNNRLTVSYKAWVAQLPSDLNWETGFEKLRAGLTRPCHFIALEEELSAGKLLGDSLLEIAGLDDALIQTIPAEPKTNESLPIGALRFMLKVNRLQIPLKATKRIARLVTENPELFAREGSSLPPLETLLKTRGPKKKRPRKKTANNL